MKIAESTCESFSDELHEKNGKIRKVLKTIVHSPLFWVLVICFSVQSVYYSQMLPYEVCGDTSSYTYQYDSSFRTPVYPMFGRVVSFFTGNEEVAWFTMMANIQKVAMFASVVLFWALVCSITKNKYLRFLTTLLYGASPAIFSWAICILTEAFSIVEIVALLFFTVKYLCKKKKSYAFWSGIMVLMMIMTRPAAVYLLVVYAVFWGLQLLIAIIHKVPKKHFSVIWAGVVGLAVAFCGVLGYCIMQKNTYGSFGLSSVAYVNDLLIVVDTDMYELSSNDEIRNYISQRKMETKDNYIIIWQGLMKIYTRSELEQFVDDVMHNNRLIYIKKTILKSINWGVKPIVTAYNTLKEKNSLDLKRFVGMLFPVSFGLLYSMILGSVIWFFVRIMKKKRLDWALLLFVMVIGGNVAVTIIAAPYEPERLCVTSLPVLIIGVMYSLEITAKYGGGKRIESKIMK